MHRTLPALAFGLALVLAACAAPPASLDANSPGADMSEMPSSDGDHGSGGGGFDWGEPADAADADRVIEVRMLDELRFDPAEITVEAGETVTFRVVNDGRVLHDFTLGDQPTQDDHEAEMSGGMSGGHDEPNVITLEPGESGDTTWRFTSHPPILYGCHVPGHYDAGMVGTLVIASP